MKLLKALLFFSQIVLSQNTSLNKMLIEGEKAFVEKNYSEAKKFYRQAILLDSKNKDALYNLAASELSLGETESACDHWYKLYLLGDASGVEHIKEFCPDFKGSSIVSLEQLDKQPSFILEGKEYSLFENGNLHPIYLKALSSKLNRSQFLLSKVSGKNFFKIKVNSNGELECEMIRIGASEKNREFVRDEFISIMKSLVTYVAATKDGKAVNYWESYILRLNLGDKR